MGRTRKLIGLAALGALVLPPVGAAVAKQRFVPTAEDANDLRVGAIFDGTDARATSPALRRGDAVAWYGGLDLDLRDASLDPSGARLRIAAVFGSARVVVPAGWDVSVRPISVFGAVETDVRAETGSGPRLAIDALALFGGVEITDRADEDETVVPREDPLGEARFARAEAEAAEAAVADAVEAAPAPASGEGA